MGKAERFNVGDRVRVVCLDRGETENFPHRAGCTVSRKLSDRYEVEANGAHMFFADHELEPVGEEKPMEPKILTAKQINHLDELRFDRNAIQDCLERAQVHFENRTNELDKAYKAFWEEIAEIHGLDLDSQAYRAKKVDGAMVVVEVEEDA